MPLPTMTFSLTCATGSDLITRKQGTVDTKKRKFLISVVSSFVAQRLSCLGLMILSQSMCFSRRLSSLISRGCVISLRCKQVSLLGALLYGRRKRFPSQRDLWKRSRQVFRRQICLQRQTILALPDLRYERAEAWLLSSLAISYSRSADARHCHGHCDFAENAIRLISK